MSYLIFDKESDFTSANIPGDVQFVDIAGFSAPGDGGSNRKIRIPAPTTIKSTHKQSADGAWWEMTEAHLAFDNEAGFSNANIPAVVNFVDIAGLNAPGDGGSNRKTRIPAPATIKPTHKQSADGAWW